MADGLGAGNGVVSAVDHRLDQGGLLALTTGILDVRTGVLHGPGTTALVTGTAATGTMTVSIAAHHWVTSRGTADGVYVGTLEAATTANIAAAPGSNSRIDVVYVKQQDTSASTSVSPDGSAGPLYGVVAGTAAVSPTKPAIPVGAVEIATVTVAAGATATNGANVTIANTARQTVARGAPIPVRNQAERDALTPFDMDEVKRLDTLVYETYRTGSGWGPSTPDRAWTILAAGAPTFDYAPPLGSWGDLTGISGNVTVPAGRTMDVRFRVPEVRYSSIGYLQLLIGGVMKDLGLYSASSGTMSVPGRLDGSVLGTDAPVPVKVQGQLGSGTLNIRGASLMSPILEYRIN